MADLSEPDRLIVALALADLGLHRPGWSLVLREVAERLGVSRNYANAQSILVGHLRQRLESVKTTQALLERVGVSSADATAMQWLRTEIDEVDNSIKLVEFLTAPPEVDDQPVDDKPYKVYLWDTFDEPGEDTTLLGEVASMAEAEALAQEKYGDRMDPRGADTVDIVHRGQVVKRFLIR